MNLDNLIKEIPHKKRSVDELITYIKTKASKSSTNYSLLLGAGASVTSGIKSGMNLVDMWRKDIYLRENPNQEYDAVKAKQFLSSNGGWYDPTKEYSSLFEKKFDLPSQRRRFIEQQVDGAFPSIGYAYLVSLSYGENIYFDTIYTTNFDDLLNESFYQFSQTRPLLCAHDSSVSSLTINSSRPKIIKLHGDYLFDDIKSTLRETESLETNIKKKLIEFSKEYGLIVVGYSGGDRSIMDVIAHLLKSEEYFKNGIYWCLRKNDDINQELKKLLWKDRVYFVEIDGFDEFMAEIHKATKGALSLDKSFGDSKREKIILSFTEDDFDLKKSSNIIATDLLEITRKQNDKDIGNLLAEISRDRENKFNDDLSNEDFKNLLHIDSLIKHENFDDAESMLNNLIATNSESEVNNRYISRLIKVYKLLDKVPLAINACEDLIKSDPYDLQLLFKRVSLEKSSQEKYNYLLSKVDNFKNNYLIYNAMISELLSLSNYSDSINPWLTDIEKYCDHSLSLNPSLSNDAWEFKSTIIEKKYNSIDLKIKTKERETEINNLLDKIRAINPIHIANINILSTNSFLSNNIGNFNIFLDKCKEIYLISSKKKKHVIANRVCSIAITLESFKKDSDYKLVLQNIMNSIFVKENEELDFVNIFKCYYQITVNTDTRAARLFLDKAKNSLSSFRSLRVVLRYLIEIYNDVEAAQQILDLNKSKIDLEDYHFEYHLVHMANEKFEDSLANLELSYKNGLDKNSYSINLSFLYLFFKKYRDALDTTNYWIPKIKHTESQDILILNQQYSNKLLHEKVDNNAINKVISHKNGDSILICGNILLNKDNIAKREFTNSISHNRIDLYRYYRWPIIPDKFFCSHKELFEDFKLRELNVNMKIPHIA